MLQTEPILTYLLSPSFNTAILISSVLHTIISLRLTMAQKACITRLPAEVVQKIGGLCPLEDLLALGRTCRRMNDICGDAIVLKQCFINNVSVLILPSRNFRPDCQGPKYDI